MLVNIDYFVQRLVDRLSANSNIHICIHYLSGLFQQDKAFYLHTSNQVHDCYFCDNAKVTYKGLELCMRNKRLSMQKALAVKSTYTGRCHLGITEVIKPLFINDRPFCIIYLGNIMLEDTIEDSESRISKVAALTGADSSQLTAALTSTQKADRDRLEEYFQIVEVLADAISMCIGISNLSQKKSISNEGHGKKHWLVEQTLNYVHQYYHTDIRLDQIAKVHFSNPQYLCRLFRKKTGSTFSDYLGSLRVEAAKKLLLDTEDKVTAIAEKTGFNSVTYFNSIFKKFTGVTPGQFRRNVVG